MLADNHELTGKIIGAAIEVHRNLGPGLLESAYEECLAYELSKQSLQVERQQSLPVTYKGITLNSEYRIDIIVNQQVVIELKSIKQIESVHKAQLLTYLRMSELKCGLLLNFNVSLMKNGIYRVLNGWDIA